LIHGGHRVFGRAVLRPDQVGQPGTVRVGQDRLLVGEARRRGSAFDNGGASPGRTMITRDADHDVPRRTSGGWRSGDQGGYVDHAVPADRYPGIGGVNVWT